MILKESGDTKYRDFRRFGGQKINEVWEQKTRENTYVCILYHLFLCLATFALLFFDNCKKQTKKHCKNIKGLSH